MSYPPALQSVVDELGRFPGVGPKSAQRITFWLMRQPAEDVARLAQALDEMKTKLAFCDRCCNIAEAGGLCPICSDDRRDQTVICVVETPPDVVAVERSRSFHGTYHVLHGVLNPLEGVTPDRLKIQELLERLHGPVREVILCFNSNVEGDATAMYLSRLLRAPGLVISQPASGLPVGGDLEYADDLTLGRAIDGRRTLTD
ncbi:MAG TPA: recombination mediator RecR [Acidimicrobiales bacterium]|nr:recombination mediator RecR [Acidimicrobiales bacterium]